MKLYILISALSITTHVFCQSSDEPFIKETKMNVKVGTTFNAINKALYAKLNEDSSNNLYESDGTTFFINPYVAAGIERHFRKHIAIHFNLGFYQTLQKYTTNKSFHSPFNATVSGNYLIYEQSKSQHLHNNIFVELLPTYIIENSRISAGLNITRTSPSVSAKLTITDSRTGKSEVTYIKDKPEESYHVYAVIGIMQGIPIKTHELTISLSCFGLLQKYDSGLNVTLGFMF
ncbi:MAG: hypothetical protein V4677_17370 [Bacteroidota bacterium]